MIETADERTAPYQTEFLTWPTLPPQVPLRMWAMPFREFGPPEVLREEELPTPEPGPGEVLVRVAAVSVNRLLDLAARAGTHPYAHFRLPHVLGAEHAGTIAAVGRDVTGISVGAHVGVNQVLNPVDDEFVRAGRADLSPHLQILGVHRPGAYAEYCVVPAANVTVVPEGVDPAQATALAGSGAVSAHQFLQVGGVHPGMNVIVPGATSGLGSTAALLARHRGANVIVTSRDPSKRARLRELGFEHVLDAVDDSFAAQARDAFGGRGADIIVDNLGAAEVFAHELDALHPGGTIVSSGAFLGERLELNMLRLYSQGYRIVGVRTATPESVRALWDDVATGFRTVVDRAFPLRDAPAAHRYVEASANVGRVVLAPSAR
ncbi:quinone oxidoreductase family protein [Microbacterium sp. RD1]|uniref:quinone oxidoreductase family protein n=1 Tax=Microbacterium sp. RD1 TaxID=3457313 RepID=UPI003FA58BD6